MKKKLLILLTFAFYNAAESQTFQPLAITSGFNADVVANGPGSALASTTDAVDNANFAFMAADFQPINTSIPPDYALPISGAITDPFVSGLSYQLASYSGNNSLRIANEGESGTLVIANGEPTSKLYLLVTSGSGISQLGGLIHFSDNSTQDLGSSSVPDWFFSNALPVVISGIGRVGRLDDIIENPTGDPRLYQLQIAIDPANQTKTITSIDFTKTSTAEGVINIFGVSAQTLGTCPAPTNLVASNVTESEATISWVAPVVIPFDGYQIYYSADGLAPTPTSIPSANTDATSYSLTGLSIGQSYCVYVRSNCGSETGPWGGPVCFTTGQISGGYNLGDIPTTYEDTFDVTTTTNCPGMLSVTVPAGFQIASVATNYDMQTASNGWMVEQRSLLVCTTTGNTEASVTSGVGSMGGTYSYSRTGLDIANGATGTVNFELRAWRAYGAGDCDVVYNYVVNNTWEVIVTYQPLLKTTAFNQNAFTVYPNPTTNVLNVSGNITITNVKLYNMLGQEVLVKENVNDKQLQLNTSGLPTGKYMLKVLSEEAVQTLSVLKK